MANIEGPTLSVPNPVVPPPWTEEDHVNEKYDLTPLPSFKSFLKLDVVEATCPEGFHNLPQDVLLKIFGYFSQKVLAFTLGRVCRNWYKTSKHPSLWRHLEFIGSRVPTSIICRILKQFPRLESIVIVNVPNTDTIIRQVCRCNPYMKHVAVRYCSTKENPIRDAVFRNLIVSCPKLLSIDLRGTHCKSYRLYQDLAYLPCLRHLNLGDNRLLTVQNILAVALNCRALEELQLSPRYVSLTDHDGSFIIDNLKEGLTVLKFDMTGLNGATIQSLLSCTKLRQLSLTRANHLPGNLLRTLSVHMPNLNKLQLSNACQLTSEDLCYLFLTHRAEMIRITTLDLTACWALGDDGLKTVVDVTGAVLEYLGLKCCKSLSSDAVAYAIERCSKLQYLNVAHIGIHESILIKIPSHLPQLKILIIDKKIQQKIDISFLKTKMKELTIKSSVSEYNQTNTII